MMQNYSLTSLEKEKKVVVKSKRVKKVNQTDDGLSDLLKGTTSVTKFDLRVD